MMTDEIVSMRFEWPIVCKLACKAMCLGLTFDQLVEVAIKEYLEGKRP